MADEDTMPRTGLRGDDIDLSDETQDFRFLASISREDAAIPKRGEKDFEPHATALQSNTLEASRQAMHNALSFQRTHVPKGHTIGFYHPESNMCYTNSPKGTVFLKMGQVRSARDDPFGDDEQRGQRVWLLPEEVLWLLERGTLDVRWPATEDDSEKLGLPMSLQGAYAMFIGDEESHHQALTFERYCVYASLKRSGYAVMRAPSWDSLGPPQGGECYPPVPVRAWWPGLFSSASLWRLFSQSRPDDDTETQSDGPLVQPGLYRDYETIYRRLAMVSFYDPTAQTRPTEPTTASTDPHFRVTFHVWKPSSPNFKKSRPGPPDFRIAVVNARETSIPTLQQLSALFETVPYDPPSPDTSMYPQLKHGYKNVILAVVDQGVTSYLGLVDAAFGHQKVYERRAAKGVAGGKRGGRRGGRGRGR